MNSFPEIIRELFLAERDGSLSSDRFFELLGEAETLVAPAELEAVYKYADPEWLDAEVEKSLPSASQVHVPVPLGSGEAARTPFPGVPSPYNASEDAGKGKGRGKARQRLKTPLMGEVEKQSNGVMIGWFLPSDLAQSLKLDRERAEKPGDLHLTLLYFGKRDEFQEGDREKLSQAIRDFAARYRPLNGRIDGAGRFVGNDEGDVLILLASVPRLEAFREELVRAVRDAGFEPRTDHGYVPHITLAYVPAGEPDTIALDGMEPIQIEALTLCWGGERETIPLSGTDVVKFNPYHKPAGSPEGGQFASAEGGGESSKGSHVVDLLKRHDGATISQIMEATGWQRHSVRGFLSTTGKKHQIESFVVNGQRVYRIRVEPLKPEPKPEPKPELAKPPDDYHEVAAYNGASDVIHNGKILDQKLGDIIKEERDALAQVEKAYREQNEKYRQSWDARNSLPTVRSASSVLGWRVDETHPEYIAWKARHDAIGQVNYSQWLEYSRLEKAINRKFGDALRQELQGKGNIHVVYTGKWQAGPRSRVEKGAQWVSSMVGSGGMSGVQMSGMPARYRGEYSSSTRTVRVKGSGSSYGIDSTVVHELGHHMEYGIPGLQSAARSFLSDRTSGEREVSMNKATRSRGYDSHEVTKPDKFRSAYVGKIYNHGSTEIVSMGLEYMYSDPLEFKKEDPGHYYFTLGAMHLAAKNSMGGR